MAIYRSQKPAWEDALLKHSTPSLLTTTTPALQTLDLTNVSLTGVGKKKTQSLGLAATLRHVRNDRMLESGSHGGIFDGSDDEDDEEDGEADETAELVENEKRKKRRVEEGDDLVLGFDFDKRPKVIEPAPAPVVNGGAAAKKNKKKPSAAAKVRGRSGGSAGGSLGGAASAGEKRPAAKEGWWEYD